MLYDYLKLWEKDLEENHSELQPKLSGLDLRYVVQVPGLALCGPSERQDGSEILL